MASSSHFVRLLLEAEERFIPLEISLELTHRCNFSCEHCYIPDHALADGIAPPRLLSLLEELAELGTLFITMTGGEVFARRDWHQIASRARELGFSLRLFSNGALIDESVADRVKALAAAVEVSLYSMKPEVFERITRQEGSLGRTLRGIELLRERGVEVKIKVPIMTHNLGQEREVLEYARRVGAGFASDPRILHRKDGDTEPTHLQVDQGDLICYYRDPSSEYVSPEECAAKPHREDGILCAAGIRLANITASGDVMACNVLPGSAGNVNRQPFREIWEGSPWFARLRSIRRRDLHVCGTCTKFSYCRRCFAQALVQGGDLLGPAPWSCQHAAAIEEAYQGDS